MNSYVQSCVKTSVALLLFATAIASPLWGQWQRVAYSGKGETKDTAIEHPLAYFTANPFLRDDGDHFCVDCRSEKSKSASAERYSASVQSRNVGDLAGFKILELSYTFAERRPGGLTDMHWKSILVQTRPDRFREIYHLQASYVIPKMTPTKIVKASDESLLMTQDFDGGNAGGCWEGYWWFDATGPHLLDFSPVTKAIEARVAPNVPTATGCWALDLDKLEISAQAQRANPSCRICDIAGEFAAHFRLEGSRVEATSIDYRPVTPE